MARKKVTLEKDSVSTDNRLILVYEGQEFSTGYSDLGLSFDSDESTIKEMLSGVAREEFGLTSLHSFKMRKTLNTKNIYLIPNSTAGN